MFLLWTISNKSEYVDAEEVSLEENVDDFSVDYDGIDKFYVFSIHKYLLVKNNIK